MENNVSFGRAARIAGLDPAALNVTRKRSPAMFPTDWFKAAEGPGLPGSVTEQGVQFLAVFARLSFMGLKPEEAFLAAGSLWDLRDTIRAAGWGSPDYEGRFVPTRTQALVRRAEGGILFDDGRTLLVVSKGHDVGLGQTGVRADVVQGNDDALPLGGLADFPPAGGLLVVDLVHVAVQVLEALVTPDDGAE